MKAKRKSRPSRVASDDGLEPGWLREQIKTSAEQIRKTKIYAPYFFPEWTELIDSEVCLKKAKTRYVEARKRWRALGSNKQ